MTQRTGEVQATASAVAPANTAADLTAREFLALLRRGDLTALEYARACADRIERMDPLVKAWEQFDRVLLEECAAKVDLKVKAGQANGLLLGIPVGVKDIFNTYDFTTGMGSEIIAGYTPGNDARVVSNIRLEGGIVAGKTVTAEFAVHHPSRTVNPHDPRRTPGTSSSGSAAAVAARMVPVALASQTGGSTIRPASYCGIFGFKPSFGLIPRTAMLKTTDTLDTVGFMARSIEDLGLLFEATRVRGHNYPVSDATLNDQGRQNVTGRPWRVGLLRGPKAQFEAQVPRDALAALADKLASAGLEMKVFTLPTEFEQAHDLHERIYRRCLAYYFKLEWDSNPQKFSRIMRRMIESGLGIDVRTYQTDLEKQTALARLFDREMSDVDVLLCLSTADEAPIGLDALDLPDHCLIWTMCGAPAISLPVLRGSTGLPIGAQIVARRYNDYLLLRFARLLVEAAGH